MAGIPTAFWFALGLGLMWFLAFTGFGLMLEGPSSVLPSRPMLGAGTFTIFYRLGIVSLLISLTETPLTPLGELGAIVAIVGAFGPFAIKYLRAANTTIRSYRGADSAAGENDG